MGAIDIIEEDKVHVTFEDGEFGWIPKDEVQTYRKPKGNPTDAPIFPGDPGDSDLGFTKDPAQPSPLSHQAAPIDYDEQLRQMLKGFKNLSGEEVTDPKTLKMMKKIFDSNGRWVPQSADTGATHINPGWNKTKEDIPFDANGEETVAKLLQMVGDPMKLLRWLIKTYAKETPNGKQRLLQYMGILKKMGVLDQGEAQDVAADSGVPLA